MNPLANLDDEALLASLRSLVQSHRRVTSDIVAHLGEVDERRIHLARGYSSLFEYSMKELGFSEDEAYRRIEVARMARRFPAMLDLLQTGTATVSALALLKHHIESSNADDLLALVSGVSVRVAKERIAARFPLPQVADSVRKLPTAASAPVPARVASPNPSERDAAHVLGEPCLPLASAGSTRGSPPAAAAPRTVVEPLAEDRFLVKVTLTKSARDKLELARDLMRHRNPDGRLDAVLEAALDALLEKLERERFGRTKRPREARPERPGKNSRTVPRASRRSAIQHDGIRCAFVSDDGRRCESRAFLEFDHITPVGKGGGPESSNIRVLCRAHTRSEAERVYGRDHVETAMAEARRMRPERERRARTPLVAVRDSREE